VPSRFTFKNKACINTVLSIAFGLVTDFTPGHKRITGGSVNEEPIFVRVGKYLNKFPAFLSVLLEDQQELFFIEISEGGIVDR